MYRWHRYPSTGVPKKSFVGTALTGVNTPAQADENCSAFEWQLNNEEIALIDSEIDRLNIG